MLLSTLLRRRPQPFDVSGRAMAPAIESLEGRAYMSAVAWDVQAADINHDGKLDVLTVSRDAGTLSVALGNGDGTLGAAQSFAAGSTPRALAVADFSSDGKLDVVTVNENTTLSLLKGKGDGTFQARTSIGLSGSGAKAVAVEVGDMNRDGKLDLIVGAVSKVYTKRGGFTDQDGLIYVLRGNGDGSFRSASPLVVNCDVAFAYFMTTPGVSPVNLALGDVNGDGKLDVVAATCRNIGGFEGSEIGDRQAHLLPGDGKGGLSVGPRVGVVEGASALSLADWNADGRLDLAMTSFDGMRLTLGNGNGTFQTPSYLGMDISPLDVAAADLNRDGKLDLVTANHGTPGFTVRPGNGDGTFQAQQSFGSAYFALVIGDFNGDGLLDVAAIDGTDIAILLNEQLQ